MKKLEELGISQTPWMSGMCDSICSGEVIIAYCWGCYASAHARLIAAAPELYDVCFRVMRWDDYCKAHNKAIEPWIDIINDMRAALAKAAGESEDDDGR